MRKCLRDQMLMGQITIVNNLNMLMRLRCHCERSDAISWDCHVPPNQVRGPRNDYFFEKFTIDIDSYDWISFFFSYHPLMPPSPRPSSARDCVAI